jgi:hypothetical protein
MAHWIILGGLLITLISETLFFRLFGFKDKKFTLDCLFINIVTNLGLNYAFYYTKAATQSYYVWVLIAAELLVMGIEILAYLPVVPKERKEIFTLTPAANLVSLLIGFLYYGILLWAGVDLFSLGLLAS